KKADDAVQRKEEKKPQLKIDRIADPSVQAKSTEANVAKTTDAKIQRVSEGVTTAPASVQRGLFDIDLDLFGAVRGFFASAAANIPAYSLLCVIIGYNLILGEAVERSFENILRGFMGLIPVGEVLFQVLSRYGVIAQMGNWVNQQVEAMGVSRSMLSNAFDQFKRTLSASSILSPSTVWANAKRIFEEPASRIKNFIVAIVTQAIAWMKEKFLQPIAEFAGQIPGYKLFKLIIGKDPFTNTAAPATPITVIEAVAEFIPGGDEKVKELKESKGLQKAYDWFMNETKARNLTWARISSTVGQIWDSLKLEDIVSPIATIQRVGNIAAPLMNDLIGFAGACLMKLLEIIYEAVMGAGGAMVLSIIKKSQATFKTIIQNPVGFLGNLVTAVGMGIRKFSGNILKHLQTGVITWLTGTLTKAGVELPATWDLKGILKLIMGILGITWPRIKGIAIEVFGAPVVNFLETAAGLVMDIKEKGFVQTIKDRINEYFSGLKEMVLGKIKSFIQEKIVMAGITQLVSLLSPVGAVIQAIIKTYQTVMFFVQKINQILEFVNSVVDSIASIANGSLGAAAAYIEATMARTIPLLLDFLARMIGLGDISGKIKTTIESVQNFIAGKIRQGMMWVKTTMKAIIDRFLSARNSGQPQMTPEQKQQAIAAGLRDLEQQEQANLEDGALTRDKANRIAIGIKSRHRVFTSFNVVDGGDKWDFSYTASPPVIATGKKKMKTSKEMYDDAKAAFSGRKFKANELFSYLKTT
ncbi:MAG: phage tail protein, partial [Bacteroidia bacterium]